MIIEISPLIEQAAIEKNAGNHENAIQLYSEAINQNPQQDYYYHLRAILYYQLEDYELALNDLNTAIRISPKIALNYYLRGNTNTAIGKNEDAALDYDQAIELQPKAPYDSFAYSNRGLIENRLFNFQAALTYFDKALFVNPALQPALIGRATARAELNDLDGSFSDLSKLIELNPNDDVAYQNMGNVAFKKGKFKEAIENYNKAYSLNPNNIDTFHNKGLTYGVLGENLLATSNYSMLIPHSMGLLTNKQHYVKVSELLKFRKVNEENLLSIQNCEVWFAHPDTFSDKDDGKYLIQLFPESEVIKQVVSNILVYSCFGIFLAENNSSNGISNKKHNVMWADYGDGSKGVCLHYQYNPEQATKVDKFSFDKITYVESMKVEENISLFDTIQHGFFIKQTGFNFENEARFITTTDKSSIKGKVFSESDLGLTLVAVDFGTDSTKEDIKKVVDAVNARVSLGVVEFYQLSRSSAGSFELNRTKLINE